MKYWNDETIEKIREGYYSAVYFNRTKDILFAEKNFKTVTMQVFQKNEGTILCGVDEILELLKIGVGHYEGEKWISKFEEFKIESLKDGDRLNAWEIVMHITGPYAYFAHLESIYLGILARRTMVATNTRKIVDAANGKPVIFFGDRFDHFLNQEGDGHAAHIGGASGVCTEAHTAWWKGTASGTIPHALIAINDGDTSKAALQFVKHIRDVNVIVLVDFDNDCVKTSLEVAKALGKKLWGVRIDTAENMIDASFQNTSPLASPLLKGEGEGEVRDRYYGVNPTLVKEVRKALNQNGFQQVKIVVSGGFFEGKVKRFEREGAPVDVYGVGSAIIHGANDFTADIVKVEDKLVAKAGREFKGNSRLKVIQLN